jgi:hypothetical protein
MSNSWKKIEKSLNQEFGFAASVALNDTAFKIRDELGNHIDEISDGGSVPFTKKAFVVSKFSNKKQSKMEAEVISKDIQSQYLVPSILGKARESGDYATGRSGVLLPIGIKLNKYGNIGKRSIKNSRTKSDVFTGEVGSKKTLGVYKRLKKKKRGGSRLQTLAIFKDRVNYNKLKGWDLEGVSGRVFSVTMLKNMREAVRDIAKYGKVRSRKSRDKNDP